MNKYVLLIVICFVLYLISIEIKKRLIYHPLQYISEEYERFYKSIPKYTEFNTSEDEHNVHGIIVKNTSKKYLLFCHGNAGNITTQKHIISMFSKYINVVIFDYTGYGKSIGFRPSEQIIKNNAINVWNYLTQDLDVYPDDITIMGESLGASVAIWLTAFLANSYKIEPNALIIQSAFSSLSNMIPNIPIVNFLKPFTREYNCEENIKMIKDGTRVLVIHSTDDTMVPFQHGVQLYNCILADKITSSNVEFHSMTGGHNTLNFDRIYIKKILKYF